MLGWGLNIVVGLAGLLDLGYVAFYAVGAYTYALLSRDFGLELLGHACRWPGCSRPFFGVLLGFPVLRLRGDYLAIVTLGFGEIIRIMLHQLAGRSPAARTASPASRGRRFFGLPFERNAPEGTDTFSQLLRARILARSPRASSSIIVILALALLTNLFTLRIRRAADRPRLGGAARGRDRLPRARHQSDQHQADRLRHRRDVRRLRRLVLRDAPGLHQPGELRLHRIRP